MSVVLISWQIEEQEVVRYGGNQTFPPPLNEMKYLRQSWFNCNVLEHKQKSFSYNKHRILTKKVFKINHLKWKNQISFEMMIIPLVPALFWVRPDFGSAAYSTDKRRS